MPRSASARGSPPDRLRPIVRPGARRRAAILAETVGVAHVLVPVGIAISVVAVTRAPTALAAVVLAVLVALAAAIVLVLRRYRGDAVCAPKHVLGGRPIRGNPLALLQAIDASFWEAEQAVRELPAGIDWTRLAPEANVLLWEAATHAARACELGDELDELRPAQDGTPEAALLHSVQTERVEHLDAMRRIKGEADELARLATSAAAAARVALASSGRVGELAAGLPTGSELAAQSTLTDAKDRLAALAGAWTALDASTDIAAERLRADGAEAEGPPR